MLEQLPPALLQAIIAATRPRPVLPEAPGAQLAEAFRGLSLDPALHLPMMVPHQAPVPQQAIDPRQFAAAGAPPPQMPMPAPQPNRQPLPADPHNYGPPAGAGGPSPLELIGGMHIPKPAMAQQLSNVHTPQPAGAETLHRMQPKPNPWAIIAQAFMQHHGLPLQ